MVTYWKDHSKYVDGGRSPSFFAKDSRGWRKKWEGVDQGKNKYFSHIHIF